MESLAAFVVASVVLLVVPGPSLLFAVTRALTVGRRRALASVGGNALGVTVQAGAVAVGLGELVARSATAFTAIKLVGAVYLVVLGVLGWRNRHRAAAALAAQVDLDGGAPRALPRPARCVGDGLVVGGLNPKTVLFFVAFLPQFVPSGGPATTWMLGLGVLFGVLAFLFDTLSVAVVGAVRGRLVRSPRRLSALGGAGGVAMVGLGATIAVT